MRDQTSYRANLLNVSGKVECYEPGFVDKTDLETLFRQRQLCKNNLLPEYLEQAFLLIKEFPRLKGITSWAWEQEKKKIKI